MHMKLFMFIPGTRQLLRWQCCLPPGRGLLCVQGNAAVAACTVIHILVMLPLSKHLQPLEGPCIIGDRAYMCCILQF